MAIRYLKIVLVIFVGLQGLLYVAGNIANWGAATGTVGYVLGQQGTEIYTTAIFPPITHPALVTMALLLILLGELSVGLVSLKGAWDLWRARRQPREAFNASKTFAVLGPGLAMVVWFGGFIVIGGALFQMWQSEVGESSFEGAFVYAITSGLVMLFVNTPDE